MKYSLLFVSLITVFGLSACDKPATVVNVPTPVAVPGPPGPQGETGKPGTTGTQGYEGAQGATGKTGTQGYEGAQGEAGKTGGDTVIIVPVQPEQK